MESIKLQIIFLTLFLPSVVFSQNIWNDSLNHTVHLFKFKPSKKIVRIEYGQITAFVNQKDYFGTIQKKDTVVITPKYLDDWKFINLLEKGKVKLYRLETENYVNAIRYRFKKIADILQFFEFEDSTVFFVKVRAYISLFSNGFSFSNDSISKDSINKAAKKKNFAFPEEFADTNKTETFKIKDYFPLHKNTGAIFYNGNRYLEKDSIVCKTTVLQGKRVFYFKETYNQFGVFSIDNVTIGDGVLFYRKDSLFTIARDDEKEIQRSDTADACLLLPARMQNGDSIERKNYANRKVITLLKNEDLKSDKNVYNDCLKFKQLTYWNDTVYLSYFWLQKNNGLVKRLWDNGGEDVLLKTFAK